MGRDKSLRLAENAGKTVLVVDDEPALCDILAFYLRDSGYKVLIAHGGYEAQAILEGKDGSEVDAVVTDVLMPEGNGIELLDNIKARHHNRPAVIFITGFSDLSIEDAYDRGAEAIFPKPCDYDALIEVLSKALRPPEDKWLDSELLAAEFAVEITSSSFKASRKALTLNIGRGGMFVKLNGTFPEIGEVASFRVLFEDQCWSPLEGQGVVRWVRMNNDSYTPPGIGLEFMRLHDDSRPRLLELINLLKTKSFIPKS